MNRLRSQRGISLIEVMAAIALFSVVAGALSLSSASNMKLNNRSKAIAAAAALAQNKLEQIRMILPTPNAVPADLTVSPTPHSDSLNPMTALGGAGGNFTRTWTVSNVGQYSAGCDATHVCNRPAIVQVAVTVSWTTPIAGSVTLVTYACTTGNCG